MGSPICPIVANLFMEDLEKKALASAPTPPTLWKRFVDDTWSSSSKRQRRTTSYNISILLMKISTSHVKKLMKMGP